MSVEDSAIAKSVGEQDELDRTYADKALLEILEKGTKISTQRNVNCRGGNQGSVRS